MLDHFRAGPALSHGQFLRNVLTELDSLAAEQGEVPLGALCGQRGTLFSYPWLGNATWALMDGTVVLPDRWIFPTNSSCATELPPT